MISTFKKILNLSLKRRSDFIKSLVFSFFRSFFGATQLLAVIFAIKGITGQIEIHKSIYIGIGLLVICVLGNYITSYFEQINSTKTGFMMIADKRLALANTLRKFPLGFFNESSSGKISATLTSTLCDVENASVLSMSGIIMGLFNSVAFVTLILFYDYRIGIIALVGMIVYLMVVSAEMKVSRKNAPVRQKSQRSLSEAAINFIQGIKVTKAYSFKNGDKSLKDAINSSCDSNIYLTNKSMPTQFTAYITLGIFESLIFAASVLLFAVKGDIDIVKVTVLVIFSFCVYSALNQAGSMLSMIGMLDSALDEVDEIEKYPRLETEEPLKTTALNDISFDNVSFSYGENEILHNISAEIKANSLTAIIGPSGSGKTTLCQLIPRFRDVDKGEVKIGGVNVKNIPEEEIMKKVSMVFQKVYLFEDTVLNNIRLGKPDADIDEVREAAKKARCDDFIMALPNGYDTIIGEGGNSLSGGEKQRISIARAIIKDSPIIILDEATSALDTENEKEILSAIDELTKNKTVIMIAHRIKTVMNADKIIAIENGKIVQNGNPKELEKEKGLFADFLSAREKAGGWQISNENSLTKL